MIAHYWYRKSWHEFGGFIGVFGFERVGACWWLRTGPWLTLGIGWRAKSYWLPVA